jgi:hypothetical protein
MKAAYEEESSLAASLQPDLESLVFAWVSSLDSAFVLDLLVATRQSLRQHRLH